MGLAGYEGQRYFWTGGIITDGGIVSWPNGISQSIFELEPLFSQTGGYVAPFTTLMAVINGKE